MSEQKKEGGPLFSLKELMSQEEERLKGENEPGSDSSNAPPAEGEREVALNSIPWPSGASRDEKRAVLTRLLEATPSATQAAVLQLALANERDGSVVAGLIGAMLHHEGRESRDGDSRTYDSNDLARVYKEALAKAIVPEARIALHQGFSDYSPAQSLVPRKGELRKSHHDLLEAALRNASESTEQRALIRILRDRAGWGDEQVLSVVNGWFDDDNRTLSEEDFDLWCGAVGATKNVLPGSRFASDASRRLRRVLPRLTGKALIGGLELLGGDLYERGVEDVLLSYIQAEVDYSVRVAAIGALVEHPARASDDVLRAILVRDRSLDVVGAAWDALVKRGASSADLARILANHPDPKMAAELVARRMSSDDLKACWIWLPASVRDLLDRHEYAEGYFGRRRFHHPFWHELEWELFHRAPRDPGLASALLSIVARPVHEYLGVYDFETITGFRRTDSVELRSVPTLRFGFLAERSTRDAVPIRDILAEHSRHRHDLDRLRERELAFDAARDRVDTLRHEVAEAARSLGDDLLRQVDRYRFERSDFDARAFAGRYGKEGSRYLDIVRAYDKAAREVALGPNAEGPYSELYYASNEVLPILSERGCSFDGMLAPDGVLGEYQPEDRSVTLFGPMIALAAADAAKLLERPQAEIEPLVRTVIEIHELAHAHLHLGRDAGDRIWETADRASQAFHEAIAQVYTRRLVEKMANPGLYDVLRVIEDWLPEEYRYGQRLADFDPELLRAYVGHSRRSGQQRTQAAIVRRVLSALPGYLVHAKDAAGLPLVTSVGPVQAALSQAEAAENDPARLAVAFDLVLGAVGELPQADEVVGAYIPGGWPDSVERTKLLFEALVAGEAVGKKPLRWIRREDFVRAVAASRGAEDVGLRPAMKKCKKAIADLCEVAGRSRDDDHFNPPAPSESAEANVTPTEPATEALTGS